MEKFKKWYRNVELVTHTHIHTKHKQMRYYNIPINS